MARYLNEYIEVVKRNTSDPPNFNSEVYEDVVAQAVRIYSRYRGKKSLLDITGTTDGEFDIALPSTWIDGFSSIKSVEFPYNAANQVPQYLKESDYRIYDGPSGQSLRFTTVKVTPTNAARVVFTVPHTVNISASTIPLYHEDAIANLATSIFADIVAGEFANISRSSLDDVAIDFRLKAQEWQILSDRYKVLFRTDIGIKDNDVDPISGWTDLDSYYSFGYDFLTHPRLWR